MDSVSDIQDYFEHIFKKDGEKTYNPSVIIQVNKRETTVRVKVEFYLKILMPETIQLFESSKSKITKDKNGENAPQIEITEVILVDSNIVNNDCQEDSRVLHAFGSSKSFGQLLNISPENNKLLKTFDS